MTTPRGQAYTESEIDSLLETIESVLPRCANEWETVRTTHASYYPDLGRTTESLKRKFASLYNAKKPTGDPTCPPQVRRAKRAWEEIKSLLGVVVDDDGMNIGSDDVYDTAEENESDRTDDIAQPPALSAASFPHQMSTPRVSRSAFRNQQSSQFAEMMQLMFARDAAEREREIMRQQEREEREERYRRERAEAEERREQRMQQQMDMMQMMWMTIVKPTKSDEKEKDQEVGKKKSGEYEKEQE